MIIFEGDNFYVDCKIIYSEFYEYVCCMVNVMKKYGVKKGDWVIIYMLMVFEVVYVMFVCVWIGVVYLVVFGGFLFEVFVGCIVDCELMFVVICDEGVCGGKVVFFKDNVDKVIDIVVC